MKCCIHNIPYAYGIACSASVLLYSFVFCDTLFLWLKQKLEKILGLLMKFSPKCFVAFFVDWIFFCVQVLRCLSCRVAVRYVSGAKLQRTNWWCGDS